MNIKILSEQRVRAIVREELRMFDKRIVAMIQKHESVMLGITPSGDPRPDDWAIQTDGLSVRAVTVLSVLGVKTLGELCKLRESDILKSRNCGKKSVHEIKLYLAANGRTLRNP